MGSGPHWLWWMSVSLCVDWDSQWEVGRHSDIWMCDGSETGFVGLDGFWSSLIVSVEWLSVRWLGLAVRGGSPQWCLYVCFDLQLCLFVCLFDSMGSGLHWLWVMSDFWCCDWDSQWEMGCDNSICMCVETATMFVCLFVWLDMFWSSLIMSVSDSLCADCDSQWEVGRRNGVCICVWIYNCVCIITWVLFSHWLLVVVTRGVLTATSSERWAATMVFVCLVGSATVCSWMIRWVVFLTDCEWWVTRFVLTATNGERWAATMVCRFGGITTGFGCMIAWFLVLTVCAWWGGLRHWCLYLHLRKSTLKIRVCVPLIFGNLIIFYKNIWW
jgi:hypothetical protein